MTLSVKGTPADAWLVLIELLQAKRLAEFFAGNFLLVICTRKGQIKINKRTTIVT